MKTTTEGITGHDLSGEEWREYQFHSLGEPDKAIVYRITSPVTLFLKKYPDGKCGTTHRVLDAEGVVHLVPAIGLLGCVVRWKPKDSNNPVQF